MNTAQTVFVVDDEPAITKAISRLLMAEGYATRVFGSAHEFMDNYEPGTAGCLLLDLFMPGTTGLDLQRWLLRLGHRLPIIFLTGFDDICEADQTIIDRVVDVLMKPVDSLTLVNAIERALDRDRTARLGQPMESEHGSTHCGPPG